MKQNVFFLVVVLCIMLSASACKKNIATIKPETKSLIEAVYASGKISADDSYKVYATSEGIIDQKSIKEGDNVSIGKLLFHIKSSNLATRNNNAIDLLRQTQADASENAPAIQEQLTVIANTRTRIENDSINYFRLKKLLASGGTSQNELDRAEYAYKLSRGDYATALQRLQKLKRQQQLEITTLKNQLKLTETDASDGSVKSIMNGKAFEVYKQVGEAVRKNDLLALIGGTNHLYLQLFVDEMDVQKLKIGQEAVVKIDMFGEKTFKARISKIYPTINPDNQSIRVDAEFTEALPANALVNAALEANIVVNKKEKTLAIPKALLLKGDSVLVKQADKTTKIKVEKGISTIDFVEILRGLDSNTELVK